MLVYQRVDGFINMEWDGMIMIWIDMSNFQNLRNRRYYISGHQVSRSVSKSSGTIGSTRKNDTYIVYIISTCEPCCKLSCIVSCMYYSTTPFYKVLRHCYYICTCCVSVGEYYSRYYKVLQKGTKELSQNSSNYRNLIVLIWSAELPSKNDSPYCKLPYVDIFIVFDI